MIATEERIGDWFTTHSGKQFWPLDPHPEDIDINDGCWALSHICRFGGHGNFVSVGEHSCHVSDLCPQHLKLCGLLHDLTEAWLSDIVRPLKYAMPQYLEIEERLWLVIADKFDLPHKMPADVKHADNRMLLAERNQIFPASLHTRNWPLDDLYEPAEIKVESWIPARARKEFMDRYNSLTQS